MKKLYRAIAHASRQRIVSIFPDTLIRVSDLDVVLFVVAETLFDPLMLVHHNSLFNTGEHFVEVVVSNSDVVCHVNEEGNDDVIFIFVWVHIAMGVPCALVFFKPKFNCNQ